MNRRMDSARAIRQHIGATTLVGVSLAALLLLPGCSQVMSTINGDDSATEQKKSIEPVETEGYLGEAHKENAGEFVFATEPITRENFAEVEYEDSFTLDEPIYMRQWLEDSLGNEFRKRGTECYDRMNSQHRQIIRIQVGDEPREDWVTGTIAYYSAEAFDDWMAMVPYDKSITGVGEGPLEAGDEEREFEQAFKSEVLPKLDVGENKITLHAEAECHVFQGDPNNFEVSSGSFTLVIPDKQTLASALGDAAVEMPEPKHPAQEELRESTLERIAQKWPNEEPLDVVTTAKDWSISQNEVTGVPVSRSVPAKALVRRKESGNCHVFDISIIQKYEGGGEYTSTVDFAVGSKETVVCPPDAASE
ncbi:MAG: hypothetical protein ACQEVA_13405 [Myxococcota bacterium]